MAICLYGAVDPLVDGPALFVARSAEHVLNITDLPLRPSDADTHASELLRADGSR